MFQIVSLLYLRVNNSSKFDILNNLINPSLEDTNKIFIYKFLIILISVK